MIISEAWLFQTRWRSNKDNKGGVYEISKPTPVNIIHIDGFYAACEDLSDGKYGLFELHQFRSRVVFPSSELVVQDFIKSIGETPYVILKEGNNGQG